MKKTLATLGCLALVSGALAGCGSDAGNKTSGSGSSEGSSAKSITYSLWDANQQPAYQKCADAFKKESGIEVKIKQKGWEDYWKNLTTDIVSGTAPDVITNHVQYYPELAQNGNLLSLNSFLKKDKVDFSAYTGNMAELWIKDGERYGIPQDWDTIAVVYNTKFADEAGVTDMLDKLTWNPKDGGTFGQVIKKLTVDKNGKRGDEPGFDKNNVKTYGWGLEKGGGVVGQTQWSWMALENGFKYLNKNPFGTEYKLSDPKLIEVMNWWQKQIEDGYVTPLDKAGQLGLEPMMNTGQAALITDGSWRSKTWAESKDQKFAFAPLPTGPEGQKTIINGLAPSIIKTTKHPEEAWKWVKYLTSKDCQSMVAKAAVVFPSLKTESAAAAKAFEAKGINVSAFVDITKDPNNLDYYPITLDANEIADKAQVVIDNIELGKVKPGPALTELNKEINQMLASK